MDLHNCVVRHAGNLGMTIDREDVTPAEILVLKALHGADAVLNIVKTRARNIDSRKEMDRLKAYYGDKVVLDLFPGAAPVLPKTLREAGLDAQPEAPDDHEEEPAAEPATPPLPAEVAARVARAKPNAASLVG